MRDDTGSAMDGAEGFTNWTAEIAALEGKLALARARLISRLVSRELDGEDPTLIDQTTTRLGRNTHIAAVKRRMAENLPGACKKHRRYLLTQEAHAEELGLKHGPNNVAKAVAPPPPDDAESLMVARLERLRSRR